MTRYACLLLAAGTLVVAGGPVIAVAQTPPVAIDRSAADVADAETAVRHAYAAVGWHAIWTDATRRALVAAMAQRERHGLDRMTFLTPAANLGSAQKVDVAYTRAALDYAEALAHGAVDPGSVHDVYTVARPNRDLGAGLVAALRGGMLAQWLNGLAPHDASYRALSDAYVAANEASADTATPIASSTPIHGGDTDPRVRAITEQLVDDGYLTTVPAGAMAGRYTPAIIVAVKKLQSDYGIATDGIVGPDTLGVLNVRPTDRARALAVALERRRWLSRNPPATRIDVNTAAAQLRYYRDGKLVDERKVIVGEPRRETPSLGSPIYRLVANPTWTVPKSIQNTELAHVGSGYLRAHHMVIKGGWIVQQPGPDNALGLVKFDMRNDQAIYLHDTSAPALFDRSQRHLSHGCVRVDDAVAFAGMLAEQEGVGDQWQKAHTSGEYTIVDLPHEIPVRLMYHNVFVATDGTIAYRTDPYGWNDAVATKLGFSAGGTKEVKADPIDVGP